MLSPQELHIFDSDGAYGRVSRYSFAQGNAVVRSGSSHIEIQILRIARLNDCSVEGKTVV
jgi:hypothetical protein